MSDLSEASKPVDSDSVDVLFELVSKLERANAELRARLRQEPLKPVPMRVWTQRLCYLMVVIAAIAFGYSFYVGSHLFSGTPDRYGQCHSPHWY
jgi:hypothetical protein